MARPRWTVALLFAVAASQQRSDSSVVNILSRTPDETAALELLATTPVAVDDRGDLDLQIYAGDEPADSIAAFCSKNALEPWLRTSIVDQVCGGALGAEVWCGRRRPLTFSSDVQSPHGDFVLLGGKLSIYGDEEPASVIELYIADVVKLVKENRSAWEATQLGFSTRRLASVSAAGAAVDAVAYDKALADLYAVDAEITSHAVKEPRQNLPAPSFGQQLVDHVCALPGVDCDSKSSLVAELPITLDAAAGPMGTLRIYRGDEGADVVYFFAREHKLEKNEHFREQLLKYACSVEGVSCERDKARVFSRAVSEILGGGFMKDWPAVDIWEGEEPADVAFTYARRFGLDVVARHKILAAACADGYVVCQRGGAVMHRFPVTEGETKKGDIEWYEHQLPADAVYDFCRREKYLQPKYTARRVRATLHANFCDFLGHEGALVGAANESCAAGPRFAREELFKTQFTVWGLEHKMRFYDDDFPPCNGTHTESDGEACTPREFRAAADFCGRIEPRATGCEDMLEPVILEQLARAERRRFEMVSPFGYDFYLSLRELRDADNATLRAAYLRDVTKLLPEALEAVALNSTESNRTTRAATDAHFAARRALAAARGQRGVAEEVLNDVARLVEATTKALTNDTNASTPAGNLAAARLAFATVPARLRALRRILAGVRGDVGRATDLVNSASGLLGRASDVLNVTEARAKTLELQSRVLDEAAAALFDAEKREMNDKPCAKIFGACCAKETPGGGKDIKCGGDFEDA
ncbi:hypothetical protein M885DRAFT_615869 [Pelagophyceae sp. CCMP2097]|nr:hypothetical protein M885DRAFT_615869 [Pelagophyceae sp. CCMP2097]